MPHTRSRHVCHGHKDIPPGIPLSNGEEYFKVLSCSQVPLVRPIIASVVADFFVVLYFIRLVPREKYLVAVVFNRVLASRDQEYMPGKETQDGNSNDARDHKCKYEHNVMRTRFEQLLFPISNAKRYRINAYT